MVDTEYLNNRGFSSKITDNIISDMPTDSTESEYIDLEIPLFSYMGYVNFQNDTKYALKYFMDKTYPLEYMLKNKEKQVEHTKRGHSLDLYKGPTWYDNCIIDINEDNVEVADPSWLINEYIEDIICIEDNIDLHRNNFLITRDVQNIRWVSLIYTIKTSGIEELCVWRPSFLEIFEIFASDVQNIGLHYKIIKEICIKLDSTTQINDSQLEQTHIFEFIDEHTSTSTLNQNNFNYINTKSRATDLMLTHGRTIDVFDIVNTYFESVKINWLRCNISYDDYVHPGVLHTLLKHIMVSEDIAYSSAKCQGRKMILYAYEDLLIKNMPIETWKKKYKLR